MFLSPSVSADDIFYFIASPVSEGAERHCARFAACGVVNFIPNSYRSWGNVCKGVARGFNQETD